MNTTRLCTWTKTWTALGALAALVGCGDDPVNQTGGNEEELITTVNLTFTPSGGGTAITAQFRDRDGPGGNAPTTTDPSPFTRGTDYNLQVELLDESENPPIDRTDEIEREAEEHQLFYVGDAVGTQLSVAYADTESTYNANTDGVDLPVGLRATVTAAAAAGSGTLRVVLKHQTPINNVPVKTQTSGVMDGSTDIDVSFTVTVQ